MAQADPSGKGHGKVPLDASQLLGCAALCLSGPLLTGRSSLIDRIGWELSQLNGQCIALERGKEPRWHVTLEGQGPEYGHLSGQSLVQHWVAGLGGAGSVLIAVRGSPANELCLVHRCPRLEPWRSADQKPNTSCNFPTGWRKGVRKNQVLSRIKESKHGLFGM